MSKLLINESPLVILPSLAVQIGLNEAIVLQQLHYWLHHAKTLHDGKKWVYKTVDEWKSEFPFWGDSTIKRAFASLRQRDLVLIQQLSRIKSDHTNYYTINYETLEMMPVQNEQATGQIEQALGQNEPILDGVKMTLSSIPENTNKITTENGAHMTAETTKSKKLDQLAALLNYGCSNQLANDWLQIRKDKKASSLTLTALTRHEREAKKAGLTPAQAVEVCVEKEWRAFTSSWNWQDAGIAGIVPNQHAFESALGGVPRPASACTSVPAQNTAEILAALKRQMAGK